MRFNIICFLVFFGLLSPIGFAQPELIIETFDGRAEQVKDGPHKTYYLGKYRRAYGVWNKHDYVPWPTQICKISFANENALKKDGKSVRLDYDVDSPEQAYNGFYIKLNGTDFTNFDTLNFYLKGDIDKGFPKKIMVELKDAHKKYVDFKKRNESDKEPWFGASRVRLTGITEKWQKFSIPFKNFRRIKDWSDMHEFVLVFDDANSRPKVGSVLLDQITITKEVV